MFHYEWLWGSDLLQDSGMYLIDNGNFLPNILIGILYLVPGVLWKLLLESLPLLFLNAVLLSNSENCVQIIIYYE